MSQAELNGIAEGVYAFIGAEGDSNAGAIETPDEVLVIDAQQHIPLAQQFHHSLEQTIEKLVE